MVEGIAITRPITVETHASALLPMRRTPWPGASGRRWNSRRASASRTPTGPWRCWQRAAADEAQRLIAAQVRFVDRRCDCSDFYLVYFPHILRAWGAQGAGLLAGAGARHAGVHPELPLLDG